MRYVVANRECIHLWAHKAQDHARGNSVSFNGDQLRSYATTIARHVIGSRKRTAILITTETYSHTTAHHVSLAKYATNHLTTFNIPLRNINYADGKDIVKTAHQYHKQQIRTCIDKATRARTYKESWLSSARNHMTEFNRLAEFFGSRQRITLPDTFDAMLEMARQEKIALDKNNRAENKKREKQRAAEHQRRMDEINEDIPLWQRGEINQIRNPYLVPTCYLRLINNGETIQTSQGAQFPVEHGKRSYFILSRLRQRQQDYQRNGHTIHCGHYAIDRMDQFGIKAGCHYLTWEVLNQFAQDNGWIDDGTSSDDNAANGHPTDHIEPNERARDNAQQISSDSRTTAMDVERQPA